MRKNVTEISFEDLPTKQDGSPNRDDVTQRKFTATSNGVTFFEKIQDVLEGESNVEKFTVNLAQGIEVTLSLQDIDAAGNMSPTADVTFIPKDVTAPAQPGTIQMNVLGEVDE